MTVEEWLAVLVSYVGNPVSMWLAINRKPFGWWIVAGTQAAFVAFAIVGEHWVFGGQVLCLAMAIYGVWRWQIRRDHEPALNAEHRLREANRGGGPGALALAANMLGVSSALLLRKVRIAKLDNGHWLFTTTSGRHLGEPDGLPAELSSKVGVHASEGYEVMLVVQDAIAELNHFAPAAAQLLRDRLEATRR